MGCGCDNNYCIYNSEDGASREIFMSLYGMIAFCFQFHVGCLWERNDAAVSGGPRTYIKNLHFFGCAQNFRYFCNSV